MVVLRNICLWILAGVFLSAPIQAWGRTNPDARPAQPPKHQVSGAIETPFVTNRVHFVGNIGFCVTNWGLFGSSGGTRDVCTGLPAPSLEFPINSRQDYLFMGALWVGCRQGRDTLVSLGADGWSPGGNEFFPRRFPEGEMVTRTTRPILRQPSNSHCPDVLFSEDAISEQDFVAMYSDTLGRDLSLGGEDALKPLGLEVTQSTYSWSFDYAQDFILMEMVLRNVGDDTLSELFMGIYMDHDVGAAGGGSPAEDDITGFTHWVPSPADPELYRDTVNLAWIADNDGDPRGGEFYFGSCPGVTGVRVVQAPGNLQFSFNWWVSNGNASRDWGPVKQDSKVDFIANNLGTPSGDLAKYAIMANGEFDYPQWESALDHSADGWLPPVSSPALALDLANGFDTRYLLSFGPFDVLPDSSLPLTFALIAGADFHTDPGNMTSYFDPSDPQPWLENLNIKDFALNSLWAGWVYDTPGYDTDGNGYRGKYRIIDGDTAFYTGDGVPDYQGPPPPPAALRVALRDVQGQDRDSLERPAIGNRA